MRATGGFSLFAWLPACLGFEGRIECVMHEFWCNVAVLGGDFITESVSVCVRVASFLPSLHPACLTAMSVPGKYAGIFVGGQVRRVSDTFVGGWAVV
mmetsp:Transcript_48908/g.122523  ORF Transcript_48908/g.122523 Transcript_48908/m.122523 type:complete len:97 (+) Transcript_48908:177-467(+)